LATFGKILLMLFMFLFFHDSAQHGMLMAGQYCAGECPLGNYISGYGDTAVVSLTPFCFGGNDKVSAFLANKLKKLCAKNEQSKLNHFPFQPGVNLLICMCLKIQSRPVFLRIVKKYCPRVAGMKVKSLKTVASLFTRRANIVLIQ